MSGLKIDLIAYEGVDELDLIGPLEVFRRAEAAGAALHSKVVAETLCPVRCAHGTMLYPDSLPSAAAVLVPGGGWVADNGSGVRQQMAREFWPSVVRQASGRGDLVMSVCTGALLLAEAGVLHGRRATTHRAALGDLARYNVTVVDSKVVDDGDLVTAGGVTCGIDLALWMVARDAGGMELARSIAGSLSYDWDMAVVARPAGQDARAPAAGLP